MLRRWTKKGGIIMEEKEEKGMRTFLGVFLLGVLALFAAEGLYYIIFKESMNLKTIIVIVAALVFVYCCFLAVLIFMKKKGRKSESAE